MFVKPDIAWIPCEEQTPKESGQYLVTGKGKYWISEWIILRPFGAGWSNPAGNPMVEAWAFIGRKPEEHETH